ncbi:MAG: acyltransferase family protein [Zavarzinia sp.]|nr:acyltransferase family protein [Zavarzinia sp.]
MSPSPGAGRRRRELDLLRIFACFVQFPFHTAKVFDFDPDYHVKNAVASGALDLFAAFSHVWRMPLFFFIAGFAAATALSSRHATTFVVDRFMRLLPPLLVGLLLFAPAIKYIERLGGIDLRPSGLRVPPGPFESDYFAFYYGFFTHLNQFTWSHLWFLVYLLLFTLLFTGVMRRIALAYDRLPGHIGWLVGPALVAAAAEILLRPRFGDLPNLSSDFANLAIEVTFFLMGAVVSRQPRIETIVTARPLALLGLGLVAFAVHYAGEVRMPFGEAPPFWSLGARGIAAWCLVAGLLGLGRRMTRPHGAFDTYMSEATLPLYVLHHLPVVALAFVMVPLDLNLWVKAAVICFGSMAITFATYHLMVRPFGPTRFLFGLKRKRRG